MDKELALAIDFNKAPKELQDLAKAHYENVKTLRKLEGKRADTEAEISAAIVQHGETEKALRVALKKWEPGA